MAIPEGYRLLTVEDVGKVFGVDLEPSIFIDSSATLTNSIITASFVALDNSNVDLNSSNDLIVGAYVEDGWGYQIEFNYGIYSYHFFVKLGEFDQEYVDELNSVSNINGTITAVGYNNDDSWNNWLYVKDVDPKTQFITGMNALAESIVNKAGSSGKKTIKEMKTLVDGLKTEFVTQEKTVTPTKSSQAVTPDSGKDGLSKVTVNAIPSNYITPSGSLEITENGTHDVTDKASVVVNVPSVVAEQWNGAYEEIVSGYTLTLNCTSDVLNDDTYMYSIDGGTTYNQFTSEVMTLENITQIRFKTTAVSHNYMKVGTTSGGGEITAGLQSAETENITLSSDIAYYIGRYTYVGGAD